MLYLSFAISFNDMPNLNALKHHFQRSWFAKPFQSFYQLAKKKEKKKKRLFSQFETLLISRMKFFQGEESIIPR
jgi:hypothetical protein